VVTRPFRPRLGAFFFRPPFSPLPFSFRALGALRVRLIEDARGWGFLSRSGWDKEFRPCFFEVALMVSRLHRDEA